MEHVFLTLQTKRRLPVQSSVSGGAVFLVQNKSIYCHAHFGLFRFSPDFQSSPETHPSSRQRLGLCYEFDVSCVMVFVFVLVFENRLMLCALVRKHCKYFFESNIQFMSPMLPWWKVQNNLDKTAFDV